MRSETAYDIAHGELIQKTWIAEGTAEYKDFKLRTQENKALIGVIENHVLLDSHDLVLDIGGRDGEIAFAIQDPKSVHLVDPDFSVELRQKPKQHWIQKVQNVDFGNNIYKLIICSHVLGYLGLQSSKDILKTLSRLLDKDGSMVLFYNTNEGYMGEHLEFSKHVLERGHYDFFDENLLQHFRINGFEIRKMDFCFQLNYSSFYDLAKCCWFLFGAIEKNIEETAQKFMSKLENDLLSPTITLNERIVFITKRKRNYVTLMDNIQ